MNKPRLNTFVFNNIQISMVNATDSEINLPISLSFWLRDQPVILIDFHWRIQWRKLFLQQLQVGVNETQLERYGVLQLPVGGRFE